MYKIDILFLDKEFEHDIYELIRAFYPESEITSSYEEKGADCDLYFRIEKQDDSCMIYYEDNEKGSLRMPLFPVQMHRAVTPKSVHMQSAKNERTL